MRRDSLAVAAVTAILWIVSASALAMPAATGPAAAAPAEAPAQTVGCDTCHDQPATWAKKPVVHAPVLGKSCLSCHNAHASRQGRLLKREAKRVCLSCHQSLAEAIRTQSPHEVLASDKACLSCHDPHAGDRPNLLIDDAARLCAGCHEEIAKEAASAHPHPPAANGDCLTCHAPHASPRPYLASKDEPALCTACHKVADPKIAKAHKGISVADAKCTSCHAPHGSASAGMIRAKVHAPFGEGTCEVCHTDPKAKPDSIRANVAELCGNCHEPRKGGHPIPKEGACVACHAPHASTAPALIAARERLLCLKCHEEIQAKRAGAVSYHPVFGGSQDCTACHELHTGKTPALLKKKDAQETCMTCHAQHAQFAHPMGEGVKDLSHPGRFVTCLSCHDPHGTSYPQFLLADARQDLCVRCHGSSLH